jgi:hypothetical protein
MVVGQVFFRQLCLKAWVVSGSIDWSQKTVLLLYKSMFIPALDSSFCYISVTVSRSVQRVTNIDPLGSVWTLQ